MSIKIALAKVLREGLTSASGEYDPARVFGYPAVTVGVIVFYGLAIYDTMMQGHFNYEGYSIGLIGIATALLGAAGGVAIKRKSESDPVSITTDSTTPPKGD